jgi:hypothetical protein
LTSGYTEYTAAVSGSGIGTDEVQFSTYGLGNLLPVNLTGVDLEDTSATPEPASLLMTGLGAMLLGLGWKRSRKSA